MHLALDLIEGMLIGIGVAIVSQWIVYPFFPEDPPEGRPAKPPAANAGRDPVDRVARHADRVSARVAVLSNPAQYVPHHREIA